MAKDLDMTLFFDFYGSLLTEKQQDILELYYNEDLSLGEIGEQLGITRQGVHDSVRRSEKQLKELEEKLGLCTRFRHASGKIREALKLAETLKLTDALKSAETSSEIGVLIEGLKQQLAEVLELL